MAPPGTRSSPSRVTIRTVYLYLRAILTALSILSTATILPSIALATLLYLGSVSTSSSAMPRTPSSSSASLALSSGGLSKDVRGRKVALPALVSLRYLIIFLAVSSLSVTMFWIFPPRATSIAVSYLGLVFMISATTPMMPLVSSLRSMTFLTLPP